MKRIDYHGQTVAADAPRYTYRGFLIGPSYGHLNRWAQVDKYDIWHASAAEVQATAATLADARMVIKDLFEKCPCGGNGGIAGIGGRVVTCPGIPGYYGDGDKLPCPFAPGPQGA